MSDLLHPRDSDPDDDSSQEPEDPGDFEVAGTAPDALEADLLWRAGLRVTDEVFILSAHLSRVRKLSKLKFEHGSSRKSLAARIAPDRIERNSSMTL